MTTMNANQNTTQKENNMKLNNQQANHLQRLYDACGNAEDYTESVARQERLDSYMLRLMDEGIEAQEINDLLLQ